MPAIVINVVNHPGDCGHKDVVVSLAGQQYTLKNVKANQLQDEPFDLEDFVRKLVRYIVVERGVPLSQLQGRVCLGEEAINMRQYYIITKDTTRTNVGTVYRDVANGANGERKYADLTGCTEFRVRLWANLVGTGPFGFRLIRDGDNEVLYENANIALTGERELDTQWVAIPAPFLNQSNGTLLRLQIKSAVAADDPIVRGCDLGVR